MPTSVKVRVRNVNANAKVGSYDAVELTGFDATNDRGFKKRFFATKKDGSATKVAEAAYGLQKDDWVEVTLDDSSFKNVQSIKKIEAPAGGGASQSTGGGGKSSGGSGGSSDKMTKEDWAAKDRAKEESMARHNGLENAVNLAIAQQMYDPDEIVVLARHFADYLANGKVNRVVDGEPCCDGNKDDDQGPAKTEPSDDDIPF